ncbi:MAG: VPLPA-CTERM sorting domain-containing protein [Pseudomonadales bacterium]|nr:VPLPA-CTERM sorting domain-containing protein [Pseudomonadales bacterium]
MDNFKRILFPMLFVVSTQAQAAEQPLVSVLSAVNLIDVTTIDGDATFSIVDQYYINQALANDSSLFTVSDAFMGNYSGEAYAYSEPGEAEAAAVGDSINAQDALVGSWANAAGSGNALSTALAEFSYLIEGTGSVELSFSAIFSLEIDGGQGGEFAAYEVAAETEAGEVFYQADFIDSDSLVEDSIYFTLVLQGLGTTQQGALYLSSASIADTGVNPVPVPAAAWLMLSGLIGIARFARKK